MHRYALTCYPDSLAMASFLEQRSTLEFQARAQISVSVKQSPGTRVLSSLEALFEDLKLLPEPALGVQESLDLGVLHLLYFISQEFYVLVLLFVFLEDASFEIQE